MRKLSVTLALVTLFAFLLTGCPDGGGAGTVTASYTVTFDTDGGSDVEDQVITSGGMVSQPSNPTKANNSFGGWYKEAALTNLWNFNADAVTQAVTLYAKWNPVSSGSFVVTFNSNGGTVISDQVIASGGLVTRPAAVAKTGAFFNGWYKEAALTNLWNFNADAVTQAVTLHAKWTQAAPSSVSVTINPDNGGAVTTVQVAYNGSLPAAYFGTGANVPVKAGFTFTGWRNGTAAVTNTTRFTWDADLVAQWARQITVKFDLGEIEGAPVGGTAPADVVIENNTALGSRFPTPQLPDDLKEDYEFAGWFNNNQQYAAEDRIDTNESEFTLTARWTEIDKNIYTQNPAIHPGNHFMEAYPNAEKTVTVNVEFDISGLFSNVEPGAGLLSAKWYRATTATGAGTQVGSTQTASAETPHNISLNYTGTETAAGTFWYWVEVTNTNEDATPGYQTSTAVTQNRLKLTVTGS